jgi:hypothetical protein
MNRELNTPQPRASTVDPNYTRDLEQRALEMMKQQPAPSTASTPAPAAAPTQSTVRTTQPASTPAPTVDPRTSDILRKQDEQIRQSGVAASAPRTTPAPSTSSNALDPAAEARARQMLLERSQPQPSQDEEAAQAAAAAAAAAVPSIDPVHPNPQLDQVHSRAYETLVQVKPGVGGQTQLKTKQERLRALTDLYKADRMTPAEYHQRRAAILAEKEQ